MNNFESDMRKALRAEDSDLLRAGDEGLVGQMTSTFRSRMRYWVALAWAMTLAMVGVCVFAGVMFFTAQTTRDWIMYAVLFGWAAVAVAMLKMWYWMEMNRNTHTREIKRVELQIARLAERLEQRCAETDRVPDQRS